MTSPAAKEPRRILIITGAGASVALGAGGEPMPMMSGWATALVNELGLDRANQIGITSEMPGEDFERNLGRFLALEQAMPLVESLAHLGAPGTTMSHTAEYQAWARNMKSSIAGIRRLLWINLFKSFGRDRIDDGAARLTYTKLHRVIQDLDQSESQTSITYATTNYDTAIETGVEQDQLYQLVDGFRRRPGGGTERYVPEMFTESFENGSPSTIRVLHLHGAVGWYIDTDGSVRRVSADREYDERETPALLLPDDAKSPETFNVAASQTWDQFRYILGRSTHVVFIGHSLHDQHVVDAITERNPPVAVMVRSSHIQSGHYEDPDQAKVRDFERLLPNIAPIPGDFGQQFDDSDIDLARFGKWLAERDVNLPANA